MLSKEELAEREARLERKRFAKLKMQEELAKREERRRLAKLKKQKNKGGNQKQQSNKIQGVCIDVKEAVENERKEKKIVESIRRTVDKRKSKTGESCSLRNS